MINNPLPLLKITEPELENGYFASANKMCTKYLYENPKCMEYYKNIVDKGVGFYKCPFGFSTYYIGEYEAFTCLRIEGFYDNKASKIIKAHKEDDFLFPILKQSSVESFVKNYKKHIDLMKRERDLSMLINQSNHEISSYSLHINTNSDRLAKKFESSKKGLKSNEYKLARLINAYSYMMIKISEEFKLYNEGVVGTSLINPYTHFDTIRKSMKVINDKKNISIKINSIDRKEIPEIECNSSFLAIAYILIDNAFKYCDENTEINIEFDYKENLKITVESYGPILCEEEKNKVFEFQFRGKNASRKAEGNGIGLYNAKKLCEKYELNLTIDYEKMQKSIGLFSISVLVPEKIIPERRCN